MFRIGKRTALLWFSFCISVLMVGTAPAQTWVASTGTVDQSSLSTFRFQDGEALVRGTSPGQVVLRFNVLPVGDLLVNVTQPCCEGRAFWVRFLDNGDGAEVTLQLVRQNMFTGVTTTLLTFDSNSYPAQSTFQDATPDTGLGPLVNFSFATGPFNGATNEGGDSVYYVEAKLIRSASGGNPGLAAFSIVRTLAP